MYMNKREYQSLAQGLAEDAHENHFPSRRGMWTIDDRPGVICLYDNNPIGGPEDDPRDNCLSQVVVALADLGIPVLAEGYYPGPEDDRPGYTRTLLLEASDDRMDEIGEVWKAALGEMYGIPEKVVAPDAS